MSDKFLNEEFFSNYTNEKKNTNESVNRCNLVSMNVSGISIANCERSAPGGNSTQPKSHRDSSIKKYEDANKQKSANAGSEYGLGNSLFECGQASDGFITKNSDIFGKNFNSSIKNIEEFNKIKHKEGASLQTDFGKKNLMGNCTFHNSEDASQDFLEKIEDQVFCNNK